jgi:heme/copper-type cytochrome/quinol oxidase subunit 2
MDVKQDAVPGVTTHISATPTQIGSYEVRCAELCGVYHAYMETPLLIVSESDFESYIATLQSGGSARIAAPARVVAWMASDADSRSASIREGWFA